MEFNFYSISYGNLPEWEAGRKLYLTNDGAIYLFEDILCISVNLLALTEEYS